MMMKHIVKQSLLVFPLMCSCGQQHKDKDRGIEPPFPKEQPREPLELTDEELGDQIRIQSHHRGLAHYGFLIGYRENQLVPLFDGKSKRVIEQSDLKKDGIRSVEDAFRNLEWIKTYPFELVAERIRIRSLQEKLITDEQYFTYREAHKVPLFQEETQFVIEEKYMLAWWIIKEDDAFPAK
jgi:hypothetical protein